MHLITATLQIYTFSFFFLFSLTQQEHSLSGGQDSCWALCGYDLPKAPTIAQTGQSEYGTEWVNWEIGDEREGQIIIPALSAMFGMTLIETLIETFLTITILPQYLTWLARLQQSGEEKSLTDGVFPGDSGT